MAALSNRLFFSTARTLRALACCMVLFGLYLGATNLVFLEHDRGSFLMYRAGQLGLVSAQYAADHPLCIVRFTQRSNGEWEYRVHRPLLGYAAIPGLVSHHTRQNLGRLCDTRDPRGNFGCEHH
ncbi:hypothetical protein [Paraburkholderia sp. 35.1]|uniref:hypothetical protein n=1 Tax=Paraburkholderia sp. 35.1 TaxID=2991058 RepID=UPI003D1A242B